MDDCQHCARHPSSHEVRVVHAGGEQSLHLCHRCFSEMQLEPPILVAGLMPTRPGPAQAHACPACGTTLCDLQASPILGCPRCYEHFRPLLRVQLRRVHGSSQHMGKTPRGGVAPEPHRLEDLESDLREAIGEQRFEDAARLRDRIRALSEGEPA